MNPDLGLTWEFSHLIPARVSERLNRFVVKVELGDGVEAVAHLANPGRLKELIFPGNGVMVRKAPPSRNRKTSFDLVLADSGKGSWVSMDTGQPNRLFGRALASRLIPELSGYTFVRPEYSLKDQVGALEKGPVSRVDFLLKGPFLPPALVEVKSVTLVKGRTGLFPDAPTERGVRHLKELSHLVERGFLTHCVFVVQRPDVDCVEPNLDVGPGFAEALLDAHEGGVRLLAYRCTVSARGIRLHPQAIPVRVSRGRSPGF